MHNREPTRFAPCAGSVQAALGRLVLLLALSLPALPAVAAETVLTLGVVRDGKFDAKATHAISERLTRGGESLAPALRLSAAERQCLLPECLEPLAQREKAQLVLMARVQQSAGFAYIAASLYDVEHKRPLDVSAVCDKCLPEAVALRVGDLYLRLLRDHRDRLRAEASSAPRPEKGAATAAAKARPEPAAARPNPTAAGGTLVASKGEPWPTVSGPAAAPTPAPVEVEESPLTIAAKSPPVRAERRWADRLPPLTPRRQLIAGILGGLGAATLVTAVALHITDGQMTTMDCAAGAASAKVCVLDTKIPYTLGYAAASAFAVSVGMTLLWPERTKSTQPR